MSDKEDSAPAENVDQGEVSSLPSEITHDSETAIEHVTGDGEMMSATDAASQLIAQRKADHPEWWPDAVAAIAGCT